MKNKYEDMDMIDLENDEDIAEIFKADIVDQVGTVGVVADKYMIEYLLSEVLEMDNTSMYYINMMNDGLHMIYVDINGYISIVPANSLIYYRDVDHVYFNMDVEDKDIQKAIDYCLDEEKYVCLYGKDDNDFSGVNIQYCNDKHGFIASKSDENSCVSYSYYTTSRDLSKDDIHRMLKEFGF